MKTITMNDYRKIIHAAKKSVENIPYSHCRILQETEERNIVEGIENARERKEIPLEQRRKRNCRGGLI